VVIPATGNTGTSLYTVLLDGTPVTAVWSEENQQWELTIPNDHNDHNVRWIFSTSPRLQVVGQPYSSYDPVAQVLYTGVAEYVPIHIASTQCLYQIATVTLTTMLVADGTTTSQTFDVHAPEYFAEFLLDGTAVLTVTYVMEYLG